MQLNFTNSNIFSLTHRTNIHVYQSENKPIVLYEDHRSLVFVLWYALNKAKTYTKPPMLIYFDGHDDAKQPSIAAMRAAEEVRKGASEKDVFSFVEWELGGLDDDWLIAAMEIGVVGDALLVGCEDASNLQGFLSIHTDHRGDTHRIWHIHNLWDALEYQGALTDVVRKSEFQDLWTALGWEPRGWFNSNETNLVLDFDLDCFAGEFAGCTLPWPHDVLINSFQRQSRQLNNGMSAQRFLRTLCDRSPFVTIARESPYCGGTAHSQQILETLDQILWDGDLFSRP